MRGSCSNWRYGSLWRSRSRRELVPDGHPTKTKWESSSTDFVFYFSAKSKLTNWWFLGAPDKYSDPFKWDKKFRVRMWTFDEKPGNWCKKTKEIQESQELCWREAGGGETGPHVPAPVSFLLSHFQLDILDKFSLHHPRLVEVQECTWKLEDWQFSLSVLLSQPKCLQ